MGSLPVAAAAVLTLVLLAGCSERDLGVTPDQDEPGRYVIRMTSELTFDPANAKIPAGGTVVWMNDASTPHDVAGYKGDPIKSDSTDFGSGDDAQEGAGYLIAPGGNYTHTFPNKGTWTIWCHTHHEERMKGIVHVV